MRQDFEVLTADNLLLAGKIFLADNPKASVLIVHGLGEYQKRYNHVIDYFLKNNISCFTFDLRGHGNSEGKRGHTRSYGHLMDDLFKVISKIKSHYTPPLFLFGHSMGGNIVANYLLRKPHEDIKAAIISSPWLRISMKTPAIKMIVGRFMLKVAPSFAQPTNLDVNALSHKDNIIKEYVEDPMVHDKITPSLFFGGRDAGDFAIENSHQIDIPLLVTHGTADKIVDFSASRDFAKKGKHEFRSWEGMYHEPHNDLDSENIIKYYTDWFSSRIGLKDDSEQF